MVASTEWFILSSTDIGRGARMPATFKKELFVAIAYTDSHSLLPHRAQP